MTKTCAACGAEFSCKTRAVFCSRSCRISERKRLRRTAHAAHPEIKRAYDRKRYAADPKPILEKNRRNLANRLADPAARVARRERARKWPKNYDNSRKGNLRRRYKLTVEEYDALLAVQGGGCAICRGPEVRRDFRNNRLCALAVDHDHSTGENRGLLCRRCNQMIGLVDESRTLLLDAVSYLDKYKPQLKLVSSTGKES